MITRTSDQPKKIEIVFPWPPKDLSPNARIHWTRKARAAKQYKLECFVESKAVKAAVRRPLDCRVMPATTTENKNELARTDNEPELRT